MIIKQSNKIKNEVISKIMRNDDLMKLLYYPDVNVDIYGLKSLTSAQKRQLRAENIFTYKRVPGDNTNEMKTYLTITFGSENYTSNRSEYFKDFTMNIFVITNTALDSIAQGSRLDEIKDTLNEIFHSEDIKVLGECVIGTVNEIGCPSPYIGKIIPLRFSDFNYDILSGDVDE